MRPNNKTPEEVEKLPNFRDAFQENHPDGGWHDPLYCTRCGVDQCEHKTEVKVQPVYADGGEAPTFTFYCVDGVCSDENRPFVLIDYQQQRLTQRMFALEGGRKVEG